MDDLEVKAEAEKLGRLRHWIHFLERNDLDIVNNEKNVYETDDAEDYAKLHKEHVKNGGFDFFLQHFKVPATGISIGCEGSTRIEVNYTGNVCDLQKLYK